MLDMTMRVSGPTQQIRDEQGRPIGAVVEPRTQRLVGRGAETVLLVRERC
jgi:hypothetical protein